MLRGKCKYLKRAALLLYSCGVGGALPTLQDPVSNPGRNNGFNCGEEKPGGAKEGKQKSFLRRQITKSPPVPLILHPLPCNIRVPVSVSLSVSPPIHCSKRENGLDGQINAHAESRHGPNVSFLPCSLSGSSLQQMGEFLRHETWRVSLAHCGEEAKEKSITKLLRLSSAPSISMWRCPELSVEVEIGPESK